MARGSRIESKCCKFMHAPFTLSVGSHIQTSSFLQSITSTFQGILITDGTNSYAVFIYECGGMEWGGGVIGWRDRSTEDFHDLSGERDSNLIGCLYSSSYSAIVYKLTREYSACRSYM